MRVKPYFAIDAFATSVGFNDFILTIKKSIYFHNILKWAFETELSIDILCFDLIC